MAKILTISNDLIKTIGFYNGELVKIVGTLL
jgi:hypothetical protein